jgi:hypothetical protein
MFHLYLVSPVPCFTCTLFHLYVVSLVPSDAYIDAYIFESVILNEVKDPYTS